MNLSALSPHPQYKKRTDEILTFLASTARRGYFWLMPQIAFTAAFGDEIKQVCLSQHFGAGDNIWSICIDNYHYGIIMVQHGEYCYYDTKLDIDDVQALVDRITEHNGEKPTLARIHHNTWADERKALERVWLKRSTGRY